MKLDTKAIRARAEAATAGPWGVWEDHAEIWAGMFENTPGMVRGDGPIANFERDDDDIDEGASEESTNNAVFAAAARTDVPALCDRVEALEAALREIEAGKTAQDVDHPLGEGFSMAARFRRIARRALEGE